MLITVNYYLMASNWFLSHELHFPKQKDFEVKVTPSSSSKWRVFFFYQKIFSIKLVPCFSWYVFEFGIFVSYSPYLPTFLYFICTRLIQLHLITLSLCSFYLFFFIIFLSFSSSLFSFFTPQLRWNHRDLFMKLWEI